MSSVSEDLGSAIRAYVDSWLLRHLEADHMMTDAERQLSDARSERCEKEFQAFKAKMLAKNGLDGGPSPAVVFDEPFLFEGEKP